MNIQDLHNFEIAKFMFSISKNTLPTSFDGYYLPITHGHDTRLRQNAHFNLPQPRTDLGKRSVKYHGVKVWSELPVYIKDVVNLTTFSKTLKSFMFDKHSQATL